MKHDIKFPHGSNVLITKGFFRGQEAKVDAVEKCGIFKKYNKYKVGIKVGTTGYYREVHVKEDEIELVTEETKCLLNDKENHHANPKEFPKIPLD